MIILIYNTSLEEHLQHLETVFTLPIKITLSKCQFYKQHLHYLLHLISEQGIQLLLDKIMAIKNLADPQILMSFVIFLD